MVLRSKLSDVHVPLLHQDSSAEDPRTAQHELLGDVEQAIEEQQDQKDDEGDENLEAAHELHRTISTLVEEKHPWGFDPWFLLLPAYCLLLQCTVCRLGTHVLLLIVAYSPLAAYGILKFPTFLGWALTIILRLFVIFDDQLSIGCIHLRPWLRKGRLHIDLHVEDLIFGKGAGFQLDFLQVRDFRLTCSIKYADLANAWKIIRSWNPVGSTAFNTQDCPTAAEARAAKRLALLEEKRKRRERREAAALAEATQAAEDAAAAAAPVTPSTTERQTSDETTRSTGSRRNSYRFLSFESRGSATPPRRRSQEVEDREEEAGAASAGVSVPTTDSVDLTSPQAALEAEDEDGDDGDDEDADDETAEISGLESRRHHRQAQLKPRLGTIRIESLDIEGAVINFETSTNNDFIVNGFVRDLALAKCKNAMKKGMHLPNTLKVRILQARNLVPHHNSHKTVSPKVEVVCRSQKQETHVVFQDGNPTFSCEFELLVDDPSTVIHVQVLDSSITGNRCIGQWVMTTYWLAVDPKQCQYTPGTLHVSREACAIRGWFPLMDYKFQHGDGSKGEILMELKWYHNHANDEQNRPRPVQPALEQLQENSAETWLRLGDVTRVNTMLETFPYKLDVERARLRDVHFFLGDLFAGSSGLAETGGRAKGIRVKTIDLGARIFRHSRSPSPGISLKEFLYAYFVRGIAPSVVGSRNILGAGLREILYSLIMGKRESFKDRLVHLVHGVGSIGEKLTHAFESGNTPRLLLLSLGVKQYHSKTLGSEDTDIFRAIRMKGYLLKADRPPGQLLRKYRRIEMTLQGDTLFYWHVLTRKDVHTRQGEGRKMYIQNIVVAEVTGEEEDDFLITLSDGKRRFFRMVEDPEEAAQLPQLQDWVRIVREQRVVMSHPELRKEFEESEAKKQEDAMSVYTRVY